ncbi:MAG TPA: hypothetical protein VNI54_13260 [Thermoanaerobaculia bacterium]|nr:hypothetical protein [Thermoanaerobaculia bacterium]
MLPRSFAMVCGLIAIANLPLLFVPIRAAEQRLWHRFGIQTLRHRLTRRGASGGRDTIVPVARRNIVWHFVMTAILAAIILHPVLVALPWRTLIYAFILAGALAYLAGSIVQRQKIAIVTNGASRRSDGAS